MSGQVTPHRQAPIDLRDVIEQAAEALGDLIGRNHIKETHGGLGIPGRVFDGCHACSPYVKVETSLRALLPQPEPTCPNCGHGDADHLNWWNKDDLACTQRNGNQICRCEITRAGLPQVRALIAAERDSAPATRPVLTLPRVWQAGDPEPEGVTEVRDADDEAQYLRNWRRGEDNRWRLVERDGSVPPARGRSWVGLLGTYGPLTEVLSGGAR